MILLSLKTGYNIADTVQMMGIVPRVLRRFLQIQDSLHRGRNNTPAEKALSVILEPLLRG